MYFHGCLAASRVGFHGCFTASRVSTLEAIAAMLYELEGEKSKHDLMIENLKIKVRSFRAVAAVHMQCNGCLLALATRDPPQIQVYSRLGWSFCSHVCIQTYAMGGWLYNVPCIRGRSNACSGRPSTVLACPHSLKSLLCSRVIQRKRGPAVPGVKSQTKYLRGQQVCTTSVAAAGPSSAHDEFSNIIQCGLAPQVDAVLAQKNRPPQV